jgi:hypothetical protein
MNKFLALSSLVGLAALAGMQSPPTQDIGGRAINPNRVVSVTFSEFPGANQLTGPAIPSGIGLSVYTVPSNRRLVITRFDRYDPADQITVEQRDGSTFVPKLDGIYDGPYLASGTGEGLVFEAGTQVFLRSLSNAPSSEFSFTGILR